MVGKVIGNSGCSFAAVVALKMFGRGGKGRWDRVDDMIDNIIDNREGDDYGMGQGRR